MRCEVNLRDFFFLLLLDLGLVLVFAFGLSMFSPTAVLWSVSQVEGYCTRLLPASASALSTLPISSARA